MAKFRENGVLIKTHTADNGIIEFYQNVKTGEPDRVVFYQADGTIDSTCMFPFNNFVLFMWNMYVDSTDRY